MRCFNDSSSLLSSHTYHEETLTEFMAFARLRWRLLTPTEQAKACAFVAACFVHILGLSSQVCVYNLFMTIPNFGKKLVQMHLFWRMHRSGEVVPLSSVAIGLANMALVLAGLGIFYAEVNYDA